METVITRPRLRVALWIVQGLLAATFAVSGIVKTVVPMPRLVVWLHWTEVMPAPDVRLLGLLELFGAIGLVLPAATRIRPELTPAAAVALAVLTVFAAGFHLWRGEYAAVPLNLVLAGLSVFVAWGRFKAAPIPGRSIRWPRPWREEASSAGR